MILFWVLVIVGIVFMVGWIARESRGDSAVRETPLDVLKKRYARGEIKKGEFEQMKKDIM